MTKEKIISLIKNPNQINKKDIPFLEDMSIKHPSFSLLHLLLAKGLLNTESIRYNHKLKKAALYTLDRKELFKLISENFQKQKTEKNTISKTKKLEKKSIRNLKEELKISHPLKFDTTEEHSFSEWLSLTKAQKINREKSNEKTDVINNFIKNNPSIKAEKNKFFSPTETAKLSIIENEELVTETLARVYLEQEHFEKAIQAYKKLSLKYPKKSSLFADQINLINNLKNK